MSIIPSGGLTEKDPNSVEFFVMDWDEELEDGVEISDSDWEISGVDAVLTKDNESIVAGNRSTRLRLSAGTLGKKYVVTNRIVTNESPSQTKDASFTVLVASQ